MFKNYIYDKLLCLKTLNRIRALLCQPDIAKKYQKRIHTQNCTKPKQEAGFPKQKAATYI